MLLGILAANMIGNMLTSKEVIRAGKGAIPKNWGGRTITAGQIF